MVFRVLLVVSLAFALAVALPPAEERDLEANRAIDALTKETAIQIRAAGWTPTKRLQKGSTNFTMGVNGDGVAVEEFKITNVTMGNMANIKRSESATFTDETEIDATLKLTNQVISADYKMTFAGIGEAPPKTTTGHLEYQADKVFIDIKLKVDEDGVPQSVDAFSCRLGHEGIKSNSVTGDYKMKQMDEAAARGAFGQRMLDTCKGNLKTKVKTAVELLKAAAAAAA